MSTPARRAPLRAALLACALLAPAAACALDPAKPITQYKHDVWLVEQGLPQNSVNSILQTRDGYVWLATQEGVVRFDGVRFTVLDRHNTPALATNYIWKLFEARDRSLWIGTNGGGLTRLRDGRFTTLGTKDGLPDDTVWAIDEGPDGSLWIGTGGGLARLAGGALTVWTARDGLPHAAVTALAVAKDGAVWVGTRAGLARLADGKLEAVPLGALAGSTVTALLVDRAGDLWIATSDGLGRRHGGKLDVFGSADGLPSDHALSVFEDRDGSLWVGTSGGGLARRHGPRFESFTPRDGLSDASVRSFCEDWEGDLWVGTYGGLNRFKEEKFTSLTTRDGLSSDFILSLAEDAEGALWLGTYGGGLDRVLGGCVTHFTTREGLADNAVSAVWPARDGDVWAGTYGRGLSRLHDGRFTTLTTRDGLASNTVLAVFEDRGGSVWAGTEGGVSRIIAGGGVTTFTTRDGLANDAVYAILEDRAGTLWFATHGGLSRLREGTWTTFGRRDGLQSDDIVALHEDRAGALWIGTDGGGLSRLAGGKIATWSTRQGLADDEVFAILEDADDHLWISCNKGVFRVAKQALEDVAAGRSRSVTCTTYGSADGMGTSECNGRRQPSAWRAHDGRLWFATIRGAAGIDPQTMPLNRLPPPVHVEEVLVDRTPAPLAALAALPPGRGELEFRYTGLSFRVPERVHFRYMLEPFDKDWVDAGTRRVAYYTNVPSGSYRFRVRAGNNDGVWNEDGATVALTLRPHFWETRWFAALVALGLASLVLGGHRLRVRGLERRERELARRVALSVAQIKRLTGLLPICASCKKIRDDRGYWNQLESFIRDRSEAEFSHGICPDCAKALYPEYTPREADDEG